MTMPADPVNLTHAQRNLINACARRKVWRATSGYDLWEQGRAALPARVNKRVAELADADLIELRDDGRWHPTPAGAAAAGPREGNGQ